MSEPENIPGTRVPDTPVHRASLWLELLKFAEQAGRQNAPQKADEEHWNRLIGLTGLEVDSDQILEAANYYSTNWAEVMFRGMDVIKVMEDGTVLNAQRILASLWLDAFEHGVATMCAKDGLDPKEREILGVPQPTSPIFGGEQ